MNRLRNIALMAFILFVTGCASPPKKEEIVFFPPPPGLPRIQYLISFTGLKDIEEESAFKKFIVGAKEAKRLDKPYGVAIFDGKIYVCDTNNTVIVFNLKSKTYETLKGAHGQGKLLQPLNISITEDGTKFVTDPVRGQVVAFDRNDQYIRAYGQLGKWKPVDAVVFEDKLYVADIMNKAVKVFDRKSGEMIKTIAPKEGSPEALNLPTNLAFDQAGNLYISDAGRFQIVKLDREGKFIATFGKLGNNLGHFARPRGVSLDRKGLLYAVDASFSNVQIFNSEGRLLLFFGEGGDGPGNFKLPAKVVIDYNNLQYFQKYVQPNFELQYLIIVTSQFGDRMVNVFGYGNEKGIKYPSDKELMMQIEERKKQELEKIEKTAPDTKGGSTVTDEKVLEISPSQNTQDTKGGSTGTDEKKNP